MISVDLSANCESWIYDPNGSGIQILGIRFRDPFSGSRDMSAVCTTLSLPASTSSNATTFRNSSFINPRPTGVFL